jgi:hypothetical protein
MAKSGKGGEPPAAPGTDLFDLDGKIAPGFWIARDIMAQPAARWLRETDGQPDDSEWMQILAQGGQPPPWPGPEKGLRAVDVAAQETFALANPGDLATVRMGLRRMITALQRSRISYERSSEREAAKTALEAVLDFLDLFRSINLTQADLPLRVLLRGLESLDAGAIEPMLERKAVSGRPVALNSLLLRGYAGGLADKLMRQTGRTLASACELVAERLDAAGYRRTADGREAITGATVRAWRREALRRKPGEDGDLMRWVFDYIQRCPYDLNSSSLLRAVFDEIRAYVPVRECR